MTVRPFTPTQEPPDDLDRRTVGRESSLAVLAERLHLAATTRTRAHTLLVGPRGTGKTHLIEAALHRAKADPATAAGLAIARLPEDAMGIASYTDLVQEMATSLGAVVARRHDAGALERAVMDVAGDRTVVAVIENLDRVFDAIDLSGQRDLRSWVETSGRLFLLTGTPALFPAVRDRGHPWHGGFIETPIEELSSDDGRELLALLAAERGAGDLANALRGDLGAARVRAMSHLTGGSPRLWMVLSECLTLDSLNELVPAIEDLIESMTPYYQSLLFDLPPSQQAIIRQLARGPAGARTAAEIAVSTGQSPQTVSKALGVLKARRLVRDLKLSQGDQRRTWYELREPMLRHHFQWRATDGDQLRLVVNLLRDWYEPGPLRQSLRPPVDDPGGLMTLLARARAGDDEAMIQLPAELRPLATHN